MRKQTSRKTSCVDVANLAVLCYDGHSEINDGRHDIELTYVRTENYPPYDKPEGAMCMAKNI